MNFGSLWSSSWDIGLVDLAKLEIKRFEERKSKCMKKWVEKMVEIVKTYILLNASIGKDKFDFFLEEHLYDLEPIKKQIGTYEISYELTAQDKDYILTEIIKHYSDEEMYPKLICRAKLGPVCVVKFGWKSE